MGHRRAASTTATLVVALCAHRLHRGVLRVKSLEDARPEARLAPAMITAVHILPGAEPGGQRAPRATGPLDPEHRGDHPPQVAGGIARRWLLPGQQRREPPPLALGQIRRYRRYRSNPVSRPRHGEWDGRGPGGRCGLPPCAACDRAPPGGGLMASAPARPRHPEAEPRGWLVQGPEEAPHLGDRQGDQIARGTGTRSLFF